MLESKMHDAEPSGPEPISRARLVPNPKDDASNLQTILVVDDNQVNLKVAAKQLKRLGYRVDLADSGKAALDALSSPHYPIVLLDCEMPEMDGYATTAEIRRRDGDSRHTIIVAMTAHALEGARAAMPRRWNGRIRREAGNAANLGGSPRALRCTGEKNRRKRLHRSRRCGGRLAIDGRHDPIGVTLARDLSRRERVVERLHLGELAPQRAALVLSLIAGFQVMRQMIGLSALAEADPKTLVRILQPVLQQLVEGHQTR